MKPKEHRFADKLREQLRFLGRSCQVFDQGDQAEAFRIATSMRVLFRDTKRSTALISHLRLRSGQMLSTSRGYDDFRDYLSFRIAPLSPTPISTIPILGNKFQPVSFDRWWCHEAIFKHEGKNYSREKIVLSAVEKDGGAHIDRDLEEYYKVLSSGTFALGITGSFEFQGTPLYEQGVTHYPQNAHLSLLRQFAHEALASAQHCNWLETVS